MHTKDRIILIGWGLFVGILIVASFYFGIKIVSAPSATPLVDSKKIILLGMQNGDAPWIAEISNLRERLNAIGLPTLTEEGSALHIHQHLDIFIDGKSVAIPAGIGIDEVDSFISPIHVHDTTGIIHIESPTVQTFTLGQFFDIWGVSFGEDFIGGYANGNGNFLKVFVNGSLYTGDPRAITLAPHQEIVITYGTEKELPKVIPVTFDFPAGY